MAQPGEFSMTTDVVVYISSVANAYKHPRKVACLENFAQGVKAVGASLIVQREYKYQPANLAVILGWATPDTTGGRNVVLRREIIASQKARGYKTMCIDASCFKYLDDHGTYLRYSLDGPFYDRAEYANRHSDGTKWTEISTRLNIKLTDTLVVRPDGHILICMQRDGGFAMKTLDPIRWLGVKIKRIRVHSGRHILIRPHPGAYKLQDFAKFQSLPNVTVVDPLKSSLLDNLQNAHAAVFFNSSASVAAAIANVPIFADDESCVSWVVANKDIGQIESPQTFDRSQWINDLAAAHWSDADGRAGAIWQKFLPYLTKTN
jgi:hypothetical protein